MSAIESDKAAQSHRRDICKFLDPLTLEEPFGPLALEAPRNSPLKPALEPPRVSDFYLSRGHIPDGLIRPAIDAPDDHAAFGIAEPRDRFCEIPSIGIG